MAQTYAESSVTTPVFFVLFPGVDPTTWVEALGKERGFTMDNGKLMNISMGQGQEAPAMAAMKKFASSGGWLLLQNLHLMQSWLPILERQLEIFSESAHADFRCFISAEVRALRVIPALPAAVPTIPPPSSSSFAAPADVAHEEHAGIPHAVMHQGRE